MRALGQVLAKEFGHNHGIDVRSYREVVVGSIRGPLQVLMGAVLCVLLIACSNVANLLLASGMSRRREIAVRLALGAGQRDVARQLTCEALVLAVAGGDARAAARDLDGARLRRARREQPAARRHHPDRRPRPGVHRARRRSLVGARLRPVAALRLRLKTLTTALREGDTRTGSGGGATFGNGLVIAEIAVAFALLVGAGLMVKNLLLLERRDAGIATDHVDRLRHLAVGPALPDGGAVERASIATLVRAARAGGRRAARRPHQPSADVPLRQQRRDDARRRQPLGRRTRTRWSNTAICMANT